jgi:hypothetical protein
MELSPMSTIADLLARFQWTVIGSCKSSRASPGDHHLRRLIERPRYAPRAVALADEVGRTDELGPRDVPSKTRRLECRQARVAFLVTAEIGAEVIERAHRAVMSGSAGRRAVRRWYVFGRIGDGT